jgi:Ca2+-binding EF-hand superfamily protein
MNKLAMTVFSVGLFAMAAGIPAFGQQPHHAVKASADDMFASLDANHDGKLSEAEFRSYASKNKKASFKDWDADGDKSISKEEFEAKYAAPPDTNK